MLLILSDTLQTATRTATNASLVYMPREAAINTRQKAVAMQAEAIRPVWKQILGIWQ